ncbi:MULTISPECIES: 6-carboxytetrahydropterin synthase QueD [Methylococcus]|uniref:6-carboxy-5,6,7,8-tetrahydropterin synthase n=1 Tax=Methylococcus capsulatus TaxID=414 RepID=A0ABZ2FBM0_METCP|nr:MULTISPECIES: 6-carboxytetrahydropterin synthase QueD [Methylococcus]MDF9393595.1 6-carboxytetrahydropterin synthase QueD [Methylococcus capsulatus]
MNAYNDTPFLASTAASGKRGLYILRVQVQFSSAHSLRDYLGDCRRMHGHNWKLEVEVSASVLDALGIALDFKTIKAETRALADSLDHRYLNEIEPFDRINPTAENLAGWFYRRLSSKLDREFAKVSAVTVWETDTSSVRYTEDEA